MGEAEAIAAWQDDKALYKAWGELLTSQISEALGQQIHEPISQFLKVPPVPRVKSDDSLRVKVQKKLGEGKAIDTIDDRVGVRFVVLLTEQIKSVERAIESLGYAFTKDRDYEAERDERPLEFAYQSVHLVVRPKEPIDHDGVTIPESLACEVQIRTLLQHAHSELTHDRLYKARKLPPQSLNRAVARSMALIEATDNIFAEVAEELDVAERELRLLMGHLDALYETLTHNKPILTRYSAVIVGELLQCGITDAAEKVSLLFEEKNYLIRIVLERRESDDAFYQTSSVLYAYLCIVESQDSARAYWPLADPLLEALGMDLGLSFD